MTKNQLEEGFTTAEWGFAVGRQYLDQVLWAIVADDWAVARRSEYVTIH